MAPQQLNTRGKVAFFERANDEIHGPSKPANKVSAFRTLFARAACRRINRKGCGHQRVVCRCVNHGSRAARNERAIGIQFGAHRGDLPLLHRRTIHEPRHRISARDSACGFVADRWHSKAHYWQMNYRSVIDIWRVIADPMSGADQDRAPRHRPVTDPVLTPSSSILSRTNDRLPPGMVRHLRTTVQTDKGEKWR